MLQSSLGVCELDFKVSDYSLPFSPWDWCQAHWNLTIPSSSFAPQNPYIVGIGSGAGPFIWLCWTSCDSQGMLRVCPGPSESHLIPQVCQLHLSASHYLQTHCGCACALSVSLMEIKPSWSQGSSSGSLLSTRETRGLWHSHLPSFVQHLETKDKKCWNLSSPVKTLSGTWYFKGQNPLNRTHYFGTLFLAYFIFDLADS